MRDFLLFTIEERRFAVELPVVHRVVRMVEVTPVPDAPPSMQGVVSFHGELVPVFDLRRYCALPPAPPNPSDHLLFAVAGGRTVALPVGQAEGVVALPVEERHLPEDLPVPALARGVATAGGEIVFILDLARLFPAPDHIPTGEDARVDDP